MTENDNSIELLKRLVALMREESPLSVKGRIPTNPLSVAERIDKPPRPLGS